MPDSHCLSVTVSKKKAADARLNVFVLSPLFVLFSLDRSPFFLYYSGEMPSEVPAVPDQNSEYLTIDQKVDFYRQEPEREEKAEEKSGA